MSPRSEEFMAMARDRLALAAAAVEIGHPEGAVSAAYYAMLYAARAALSEHDRNAKTHSGTWSLFREVFVLPGRFQPELADAAKAIQRLREDADYDAASIPADDANDVIALARRFVGAVEDLLAG